MEVIITKSYEESCQITADRVVKIVNDKPESKLGLATGGTAESVYALLVKAYNEKQVSFKNVSTVNLDEYVGLSQDSPQSYRKYMNSHLFDNIDIDKGNTYVANGINEIAAELELFKEKLYGDGKDVDFQLLGVGVSGHIGFNEPGDKLNATVHVEKLEESTIEANARFFEKEEDVPKEAITMGMGDILKAKEIILIASGEAKAPAMKKLLCNDMVDPQCPVTFLKLHPNTKILIDEELSNMIGYK